MEVGDSGVLEAERARLVRAREQFARLQTLTAALAGINTPEAIADVAVAQGIAATGASTGVLTVRDAADPSRASVLHSHGVPDDLTRALQDLARSGDWPSAECIRTGKALFIESVDDAAERFPGAARLWKRLGTRSMATVPLLTGDEPLGAMSFSFVQQREFPDEARELFLALARQTALGLERARLFAELVTQRETALRAKMEAEQTRAAAEQAALAKGQFLATMSHELRTPINAQIGYTQLLQLGIAGPLTAEQNDYLARLSRSSEHLLGLINDVLDLSKIESGQLAVARDDAMTGTAVDAALDVIRPLADARQLRLRDSRPDPVGVPFVGDEQRVRQVLVNLLSNAVKFTAPGGRIEVSCGLVPEAPAGTHLHGTGPWAFICVEDTGTGIAPDQISRVFEPFHQVHGGHARPHGGTGLGLAISRRLARLMGGDLTLESALGAGSRFMLWLPAAANYGQDRDGSTSREPAADRRARAERTSDPAEVAHLARVGSLLRASIEEILSSYTDRLRAEPEVPRARTMSVVEIEDHALTLLSDVAQSLVIASETGLHSSAVLRDSSAIQRVISEQHGLRRHAQGWTESAVRNDLRIFREEIQRVLRGRLSMGRAEADRADTTAGLAAVLGFVDHAETISLRSFQAAQRQ